MCKKKCRDSSFNKFLASQFFWYGVALFNYKCESPYIGGGELDNAGEKLRDISSVKNVRDVRAFIFCT
jgi:hypothetical protein